MMPYAFGALKVGRSCKMVKFLINFSGGKCEHTAHSCGTLSVSKMKK